MPCWVECHGRCTRRAEGGVDGVVVTHHDVRVRHGMALIFAIWSPRIFRGCRWLVLRERVCRVGGQSVEISSQVHSRWRWKGHCISEMRQMPEQRRHVPLHFRWLRPGLEVLLVADDSAQERVRPTHVDLLQLFGVVRLVVRPALLQATSARKQYSSSSPLCTCTS